MRGNAGVRAGLAICGLVGDGSRAGGWGNTLGLGSSSDDELLVVEGCWIGRASDSPLD